MSLEESPLPLSTQRTTARPRPGLALRLVGSIFPLTVILAVVGFFYARHYVRTAMHDALPQLDGTVLAAGLAAPVTVERNAQGVPSIHAATVDDLVFAQGYVTAQDRLWQMDLLRRHAAGELAAILGATMLDHDRLQRTLQMRATADRAIAVLPPDQRHWLDRYAAGVNASIAAQGDHLPLEFRLLKYDPQPWTPRDSLLVGLVMYQDLTTGFPVKLARESLAAVLPPALMADLYPVGSWRDHPPGDPIPDLTSPQPEYEDIPLDESQSRLRTVPTQSLVALERTLALFHDPCDACVAGSNGWAVAGTRTASGQPLLANDTHLAMTFPGLWYEADLVAETLPTTLPTRTTPAAQNGLHVAGLTLPGTPFVISGHNASLAWGFTNLGADVQDISIEHTRGTPHGAQYQALDGTWQDILYDAERIHVRGAADVVLQVPILHHGSMPTPVISGIFPGERRTLSLRWTAYDPVNVTLPFYDVALATDSTTLLAAFANFGGPTQNLMYAVGAAPNQTASPGGHIGYHAVGRIPLRGSVDQPAALSALPTDTQTPDAASHEWAGYIPFDKLPQAMDPADGILATANARVTPVGYPLPITLDWAAPYRTERIYKVLESGHRLRPEDMLRLQGDTFSSSDLLFAQRLAYAIDHTTGPLAHDKQLHQAADLLRNWRGSVDSGASAPAIVNAARAVFWPMLLDPKLAASSGATSAQAYLWGEKDAVEEQLLVHTPARWLPPGDADWNDLLAAVAHRGLAQAHAPGTLTKFSEGKAYPLNVEHPVFARSELLKRLIGAPVGTGPTPQDGDGTTVRQVGHAFGPSARFTADLADPDNSTLNITLGQSGNVGSPHAFDQLAAWLRATTYPLPFHANDARAHVAHTLTLKPQ